MYIAIRATSVKNKLALYVNNFKITKSTASVNGPSAVTDLVGKAGEKGALNATVTFKLPTTTYLGDAINENITVDVETLVDFKTISGAPGSTQTVNVQCIQSTTEEIDPILITPKVGNNVGVTTKLPLWVGMDLPATPKNVRIIPNETCEGGILKWDKVGTVGENGGYVDPAEVNYYLCQRQYVEIFPGFGNYQWIVKNQLGTDIDEWSFSLTDPSQLVSVGLSVVAENIAGMNYDMEEEICTLGTPYKIPAVETYGGGKAVYSGYTYESLQAFPQLTLAIKNPSTLGEQFADDSKPFALIGTCNGAGEAYVELPPFSTKGSTNVAIIPNVYVGGCENIRVSASTFGQEDMEIFNLSTLVNVDLQGYEDLIIDLPATFQNKDWVKFRIYGEFSATKPYLIIGGYFVRNMVPYEIVAADIAAPLKVTTGQDYNVTVTSSNNGLQTISNYTVELYENGKLVDTKEASNLLSDESSTVTFVRTMSPIAEIPNIYYAKVNCANDATDSNNETVSITVDPRMSSLPGVTELQANNSSNGNAVTLT